MMPQEAMLFYEAVVAAVRVSVVILRHTITGTAVLL